MTTEAASSTLPSTISPALASASEYLRAKFPSTKAVVRHANIDRYRLNHALETAAPSGDDRMVQLILDRWESLGPETLSKEFRGALRSAAKNGHSEIVKSLIKKKDKIDVGLIKDTLKDAMLNDHREIVDLFRNYIATECRTNLPPGGVLSGFFDRSIIENNPKEVLQQLEALFLACLVDDVIAAIAAIKSLAEFWASKKAAAIQLELLRQAVLFGSSGVLRLLIETRLYNDETLSQIFVICCGSNRHKSAGALIEFLGQRLPETERDHGMIIASGNGNLGVVRLLIDQSTVQALSQDALDCSLNVASLNDHAAVVNLLLQNSANPNAIVAEPIAPKNPDSPQTFKSDPYRRGQGTKRTALQVALSGWPSRDFWHRHFHIYDTSWQKSDIPGREATIGHLLTYQADIKNPYNSKRSLLHHAVERCSGTVVKALIHASTELPVFHSIPGSEALPKYSEWTNQPHRTFVRLIQSSSSASTTHSASDDGASSASEMSLLELAAQRELGSVGIIDVLLQAGAETSNSGSRANPVLSKALDFFGGIRERWRYNNHDNHDGRFIESKSVSEVLEKGPGAAVKVLLTSLPLERTDDGRYDLLLQMAIIEQDRDLVAMLLDRGIDVNASSYYYGNALQCAARVGDINLARMLLKLGAKVNVIEGKHGTALRAAIVGNHGEIVDLLLKHGANTNLRETVLDNHRNREEPSLSILHLCLETHSFYMLRSLLRVGAEVNVGDIDQKHILTKACELGNTAIVQLLLDHGAFVNAVKGKRSFYYRIEDENTSALHMACAKGHEAIVSLLLQHGADTGLHVEDLKRTEHSVSKSCLQLAAENGHAVIVRLLVQNGADANDCNCHGTALSMASESNKIEVAEELLRHGATIAPLSSGANALAKACGSRRSSVISLLLAELSGTDEEEHICADALASTLASKDDDTFQVLVQHTTTIGPSMLSRACAAGLLGSVRKLLDLGVDPNDDNEAGCRAIHAAAFHQNTNVLQLLLSRGASVKCDTAKYGNPLQAQLEGFAKAKLGIPPEVKVWNETHRPAPHDGFADEIPSLRSRFELIWDEPQRQDPVAEFWKFADCERGAVLILDQAVEIDSKPRNLGTPLHLACFIGTFSIVKHLLAKGANVQSTCERFGSTLIAALDGGNIGIAELLIGEGVDVNYVSQEYGSALHFVCKKQVINAVRMLLQHGVDVNATGGRMGSPFAALLSDSHLHYASMDDGIVEKIAKLLLSQSEFQVQEQDMLAALKVSSHGEAEKYVRLLLEKDSAFKATEAVLVTAISNLRYRTDILELLLKRDEGIGTKEAMLRAAAEPDKIKILLGHSPVCPVTQEIVLAMVNTACYSIRPDRELMQLLLEHQHDLPITEEIMLGVLATKSAHDSHPNRMSDAAVRLVPCLLERQPDLPVSPAMLKAAKDPYDLKALLARAQPNGLRITPDIFYAAAPSWKRAEKLVLLLLAYDTAAEVPVDILARLEYEAGPWTTISLLELLFEGAPRTDITTAHVTAIVSEHYYEFHANRKESMGQRLVELLLRHGKRVIFVGGEATDEGAVLPARG